MSVPLILALVRSIAHGAENFSVSDVPSQRKIVSPAKRFVFVNVSGVGAIPAERGIAHDPPSLENTNNVADSTPVRVGVHVIMIRESLFGDVEPLRENEAASDPAIRIFLNETSLQGDINVTVSTIVEHS